MVTRTYKLTKPKKSAVKEKKKYNVYMTNYYKFEGVLASSEEEAKEAIASIPWSCNLKDVIFDVECTSVCLKISNKDVWCWEAAMPAKKHSE